MDVERVVRLLPAAGTAGPFLLGLDGRSGSGKSRLAAALARARPDVRVVALEVAYPGWWQLRVGVARVATGVLVPLSRGAAGSVQRYDWHRRRPGAVLDVSPAPVVVVEGCGATSYLCRPYLDAAVWLAVPEAVRRARAMARDAHTWAGLWHQWAAQEAALQPEPEALAHADLVL